MLLFPETLNDLFSCTMDLTGVLAVNKDIIESIGSKKN